MTKPFQVEFEYAGRELRVKGEQTPRVPANLKGHPDTWSPEEGLALEDLVVYEMTSQGHYISLSLKDEKNLLEDHEFMEELGRQV